MSEKVSINELSLVVALSKLDCGDNSCLFAKDKKGMRTNGGCRCLTGLKLGVRMAIEKIWYAHQDDK